LSWCTERAIYKDGEYHILYRTCNQTLHGDDVCILVFF
jgi:hypothetical protein